MATYIELLATWRYYKALLEKIPAASMKEGILEKLIPVENSLVDLQARRVNEAVRVSSQTRVSCALLRCDALFTNFVEHYKCVMKQLDSIVASPGVNCSFWDASCCSKNQTLIKLSDPKADQPISTTTVLIVGGLALAAFAFLR